MEATHLNLNLKLYLIKRRFHMHQRNIFLNLHNTQHILRCLNFKPAIYHGRKFISPPFPSSHRFSSHSRLPSNEKKKKKNLSKIFRIQSRIISR